MQRRHFLTSLLAGGAAPALSWADAGGPVWLTAARDEKGAYALFGLAADGADCFRITLPGRGHAAAAHPTAPEAVAFARRPGIFGLVVNCATGAVAHRLRAAEGRYFYGHGAFVAGGDILVTTESDVAGERGVLGLWSRPDGYVRIGEIPSNGVGPHDILALPGDVLAVANGGILTGYGRTKLNLDTMRPNLTYLTVDDGPQEVVELDPEIHKLSIRHLAQRDGMVAFAMQWQGGLPNPVPLLGLHRRGQAPVLCQADPAAQLAMDGYAGSVAMTADRIGITSPRGGRVHVFGTDGRFRQEFLRPDVCGLAARGPDLVATDGMGGILALAQDRATTLRLAAPRAFDNHLIRIGA